MTLADHVEQGLGIMSLVTIGVIAGSLHLAVFVIVDAIRPQWRRIVRLASGHIDQGFRPLTPTERGFAPARGRDHG